MRVHVVSDVHGNVDALARAAAGADALVVLGDLLDFVDYHNHERGIMGTLFGAANVSRFAALRRSGNLAEMGAFARTLWASLDDPVSAVLDAVHKQYDQIFAVLSTLDVPVYATPGNVDAPQIWSEYSGGVQVLDGQSADVGGLRFGFIGGGLAPEGYRPRPGAAWRPYMRTADSFEAAADDLGAIDVLCSHIPPSDPLLSYDVVARRFEFGSSALRECIVRQRPRWSLFGHVHQPLAGRVRIGWTECCNVGHFQNTEQPFVLHW